MEEVWKTITDYEGLYEVSNLGNVRSLPRTIESNIKGKTYTKTVKGVILSGSNNGVGYLQVPLSKNGIRVRKYIHVLVANAFLIKDSLLDTLEVNHIDHNKANNNVLNLEYVTKSENQIKSADFYGRKVYKCIECESLISDCKAKRCLQCSRINSRKVKNRPSKEDLLKLLENNSFLSVGKMFNVSDNTIRKWLI